MTFSFKNIGTGFTLICLVNAYSLDNLAVVASPGQVNLYSASNAVFQPILPKLTQKTQIKMRLPKYIPYVDGENPLYAIIETATKNQYQIMLAYAPDCGGGNACRLGFVAGEAITQKTPRLSGKIVSLNHNITGYFTDASCGANCSDSTLTWRQQGVQYTVGIKAGDRNSLAKMAKSAQ